MDKLKQNKGYKIIKRCFFIMVCLLLKTVNIKGWKYYFSKWVADDGDNTLLTKYPLNPNSVIIDVGGYIGSFSDKIISLYNPYLIIFEPVRKYYKILKKKYAGSKNIMVYNYGLSNKNCQQKIYLSDDGTSLIKKSDRSEKIKLIDTAEFIRKIKNIDLMSINIEGAEYQVLERLIETSLINKIKYLQVQFHSFVPGANNRRRDVLKNILKTHKVYFSYPFVWESFKLKN